MGGWEPPGRDGKLTPCLLNESAIITVVPIRFLLGILIMFLISAVWGISLYEGQMDRQGNVRRLPSIKFLETETFVNEFGSTLLTLDVSVHE